MSVKNVHTQYANMLAEWQKNIDFGTAQRAVHDRGTLYLPALSEQTAEEYADYLLRSPVMMYALRASRAMVGMATRKDPIVENRESLQPILDHIGSDGSSMNVYIVRTLLKFITTGRGATLADMPKGAENLTILQAEERGITPKFIHYTEKDVLNWRTELIENKTELVMVVLRETVQDMQDEFTWTDQYRYRVLDLYEGKYRQRLFDEYEVLVPGSEVYPKMDNKTMDYIPIRIHGGIDVQYPPLNGIVDLTKSHYQLGADEMWGLRMAALPTAYFFGEDPESDSFPNHVGPGRVIGSAETDCKTGFREFTGNGMGAVANKLKQLEDNIVMLSVQMAVANVEKTATESSIDYANATATLSGMISLLSEDFNWLLKVCAGWVRIDPDTVGMQLNKDFMPATITPQYFLALLSSYEKGTISYDTFYANLARGEVTSTARTPEEELAKIESEPPTPIEKQMQEEARIAKEAADAASNTNPPEEDE